MSVTGTVGANGAATQKIDAAPFEFGRFYDINGTTELLGDLDNTNSMRFDFGVPLTAWRVETRGIADAPRPTTINVYDTSDALLGSILMASDGTNREIQFYGFQLTGGDAAAYLTVTNATGSNDVFGMDNVRFVQTAPEPGTLALLACGLVAGVMRRRQVSKA